MPVGFKVISGIFISGFLSTEVWSKFSSGQVATITGFSHSKRRSIGGFLYVQITSWALSLTALRESLRQVSNTGLKSANSFLP